MARRNILAILVVFIVSGVVLGVWHRTARHHDHYPGAATTKRTTAPTSNVAAKAIAAGAPKYIRIPKLGLQANVQAVGLNAQGNMAAPNKLTDVAWYKPGPQPGVPGNAVIAGHFGKPHQTAFWNLNQLKTRDLVEVVDSNGQLFTFEVTATERVNPSEAERQRIFGASNAKHLNLITCDGAWNKQTHSYDLRFIVYTTMRQ